MKINGKELGMAYTVGAHTDWDNYVVKNQQTVSVTAGMIEKVIIMHRWWAIINKVPESKRVTREEILAQPDRVFDEMVNLSVAIEKGDSEKSIEAVDTGKNVESAAKD